MSLISSSSRTTDLPSEELSTSKLHRFFNFLKNYSIIILYVIFLLLFFVVSIEQALPKIEEITISSFSWERSISIEKYQLVHETDWNLPNEAELEYTNKELYKYEQVLDHYEEKSEKFEKKRIVGYRNVVVGYKDLGNGYFEEETIREPIYEKYTETSYYEEPVYKSVPIYKTKYYYKIYRWKFDRTLPTIGFDRSPYWADISNLTSDERASNYTEKYYISGRNSKGESKRISIDYSSWKNLELGQTIKVKVFFDGSVKIE